MSIYLKKLWSDKGHGELIRIINCRNDDDEAERVAKEIITHKLRNANEWQDYAVLYRSNFRRGCWKHSYVSCKFLISYQAARRFCP